MRWRVGASLLATVGLVVAAGCGASQTTTVPETGTTISPDVEDVVPPKMPTPSEAESAAGASPEAVPAQSPSPDRGAPPARGGAPSVTCINGWATPELGSEAATFPLDALRAHLGLGSADELVVDTIRYFTGPEDVEIVEPRRDVERWYVEAVPVAEAASAGRWLIRRCDAGSGVAAFAPSGTTGFGPGLWWSRSAGGYDPFDPPCTPANGPYCPCAWGIEGCSCENPNQPACTGPPPEVMGCLSGL